MPSSFKTDRRSQQLRKLTEVSRALTYAISLDEVLDLTVRRAGELLESDKAVLMLTNDDGLLVVRASFGLERSLCNKFREPLHETLATRLQGLLGPSKEEHFLGVPLVVSGAVTGLLAVARPKAMKNAEGEEWLLSALADQAAVALEKTRLDQTAEFRERLIGIVSHDLKNPISAILLGATNLLRGEELNEGSMKAVARIQSSAERANRMIRDLLDYTQARLGGGLPIAPKPMDLHAVVRQVVEELEVAQPERKIKVSHEGDARGEWDVDRLAQVVGNLVSNALHYSPADTEIQVVTREVDGWATFTVHNEGRPIPRDQLPHLFEPMQRSSSELNMAGRSVGLGLYIVKHIVTAHKGTIDVKSNEKEGTTLTVRLPRHASF